MTKIHHLALGAVDVDGLSSFYAALFDLPERTRHHHADGALRAVWLDLEGAVLMIERRDADPREKAPGVDDGLFLLSLRAGPDGLAGFEQRCQKMGVVIENRTAHTLYIRDPEQNRVALSDHPLGAD